MTFDNQSWLKANCLTHERLNFEYVLLYVQLQQRFFLMKIALKTGFLPYLYIYIYLS